MEGFRVKGTPHLIKDLGEYINTWIKDNPRCKIAIGCDSMQVGDNTKYAIAICLVREQRGGHILVKTFKKPRFRDLWSRLSVELDASVEVAQFVKESTSHQVEVHIDFNCKEDEKTYALYQHGMGYVKSLGMEPIGKPAAWAASSASDHELRK